MLPYSMGSRSASKQEAYRTQVSTLGTGANSVPISISIAIIYHCGHSYLLLLCMRTITNKYYDQKSLKILVSMIL